NTLVISHANYNYNERTVLNFSAVKIRLDESYLKQPDTLNLLYGSALAENFLGAISTVHTRQLTTNPSPIFAAALPGRLAGLYTEQVSGWPPPDGGTTFASAFGVLVPFYTGQIAEPSDNKEFSMVMRGAVAPITIIDGVQRELYAIDPESIESISLLKDGLSTILLGQRSSAGVLLVTTKRGKAGPPKLSFTAQTGFQNAVKLPEPLHSYQYAFLFNEARSNEGRSIIYLPEDILAYKDGSSPYGYPDVNWFNTILRKNAPIRRYNLTFEGGGTFARYNVGLSYLNQQGAFVRSDENIYNTNNELKRYLVTTNIEITPNKNFSVALDFLGRIQQSSEPGVGFGSIFNSLYNTPNLAYPVLNPDGSLGASDAYRNNIYGQAVNSGYFPKYAKDLVIDLELNYKFDDFLKGLYGRAKGNFSLLSSNASSRGRTFKSYYFIPTDSLNNGLYTPYGEVTDPSNDFRLTTSAQYVYAQLAIGFKRQFGKHGINTLLFADMRSVTVNFDLPAKYTNYAFKADYDFLNKYLVQGAVTYSGYDRFKPGKQFGFFYAGGLGWKISEERFIKDNFSWINFFKLRATYAKTGNANVGYFIWRRSFGPGSPGYFFGQAKPAGNTAIVEGSLINENATWEKANKFNIGIDLGLFADHLQVTAEYYNNRFYDIMQLRGKTSALAGNTFTTENRGIYRFKGTEYTMTYSNHLHNFNYFITGNASIQKTVILFKDEIKQPNDFNARTGQPVNAMFGYLADGFFNSAAEAANSPTIRGYVPKPGDIKYKDIGGPFTNADGSPIPDGVIDQFDETYIGTNKPLIYYGATLGFSFKGFDMSVLLQGVTNRVIYQQPTILVVPFGAAQGQAYQTAINRWTPETAATATLPRLSDVANLNNYVQSSFWVHSGNYFRLKNIDVGYTFPYKLTSKLKVSSLRIFANGYNLFTDSGYGLIDPEQSQDPYNYPIQKIINLGINIKL
ncbi:MAG: SusC/RagA family TonB-linked outer membrane protein, partial [Mucilaginibacter sp.]